MNHRTTPWRIAPVALSIAMLLSACGNSDPQKMVESAREYLDKKDNAAAIIQLLKGEAVNPTPVVMNTCYSFVTARDVVHVASVHQYDAAGKTFKTVPGSGGLSAAPSALEAGHAWSWARQIWADTLA